MKKALNMIIIRLSGKSRQTFLLDFVSDKKNIERAVEGSMEKRAELIDRVKIKEKHA